jgi:hypothetical protein
MQDPRGVIRLHVRSYLVTIAPYLFIRTKVQVAENRDSASVSHLLNLCNETTPQQVYGQRSIIIIKPKNYWFIHKMY